MGTKKEQVEFSAKALYFLGKEFESQYANKFKTLSNNVFQGDKFNNFFRNHPTLKYELIGQVLMDKLSYKTNKKDEEKPNAKLPVAQTIVQRLVMNDLAVKADRETYNRVMTSLELKDEAIDEKEDRAELIKQLNAADVFDGEKFRDLSDTDFDAESSDYDYNAFSLLVDKAFDIDEIPDSSIDARPNGS